MSFDLAHNVVQILPALIAAVQRNCDISDARHAGDYGLCTFLLKMREYYRWEQELPLTRNLPQEELGDWLSAREQFWDGIEAESFVPLPLECGDLDPFAVAAKMQAAIGQYTVHIENHQAYLRRARACVTG